MREEGRKEEVVTGSIVTKIPVQMWRKVIVDRVSGSATLILPVAMQIRDIFVVSSGVTFIVW